ncbi:cold and drought-regulated protein CORA-like [Actinidia eriantha]|uniref:cold and drought-regulated protein CORA-like n=1 Tax=Actinidia eriantha TaxID=165200 RepID=UPI00258FFFF3|nr:cold and drought-regulated protein CORA-like [Actinidia eriantha]
MPPRHGYHNPQHRQGGHRGGCGGRGRHGQGWGHHVHLYAHGANGWGLHSNGGHHIAGGDGSRHGGEHIQGFEHHGRGGGGSGCHGGGHHWRGGRGGRGGERHLNVVIVEQISSPEISTSSEPNAS